MTYICRNCPCFCQIITISDVNLLASVNNYFTLTKSIHSKESGSIGLHRFTLLWEFLSFSGFPRDLLSLSISDLSPLLQAFLPEGCPTSLTSDIYYLQSYKGVCYWFIPYAKRTWLKAGQICSDKGGKYLEIRSEDELDFIVDHMEKTYSFKYPVWLGLKNGFRYVFVFAAGMKACIDSC